MVEQPFNSALPAKSNDLFDSGAIALAEEPHWTCPVFLKSFMWRKLIMRHSIFHKGDIIPHMGGKAVT